MDEEEKKEEQARLACAILQIIHRSDLKLADIVYSLTVVLTTVVGSRAKHPNEMLDEIVHYLMDYPIEKS